MNFSPSELAAYLLAPMPANADQLKKQSMKHQAILRSVKPTTPQVVVFGGQKGLSGLTNV